MVENKAAKNQDTVITRVFEVSRDVLWKAWTDSETLKTWWGPQNHTSLVCKVDLRVGGSYLFCMRSPEGQDVWITGVYREIVKLERLVFTDSFADEKGNVVPASHYGMSEDMPLELLCTLTFEDHEGKTKFTLKHSGMPAGQMRDMTEIGWNQSFDKLAASLQ